MCNSYHLWYQVSVSVSNALFVGSGENFLRGFAGGYKVGRGEVVEMVAFCGWGGDCHKKKKCQTSTIQSLFKKSIEHVEYGQPIYKAGFGHKFYARLMPNLCPPLKYPYL
jgi:hypothetical protein